MTVSPTVAVAVIGGGPAGASAALALARQGIGVVVLEPGQYRTAVGETLPPNARPLLDGLGLRSTVEAEGFLPSVGNWSAWGGPEPLGRDFMFNRHGNGWHLDRRRFDALLRKEAEAAGADIRHGVALANAESMAGGGFRLRLHGGNVKEIEVPFAIDASGRSSVLARALGHRRRAIDRLIGIAGFVVPRGDAPEEPAVNLVEAVEAGWWYSAPLPQRRLAAVFMTDSDLARDGAATLQGWLDRLAAAPHTGARVARYGIGLAGPPVPVPASSARLDVMGGHNWLAIGDAACSHDPLSSQGLCSALETGLAAASACVRRIGGAADAFLEAADRQGRAWDDYAQQRTGYYRNERRWPMVPFWQRRQVTA